jgi:hypothetical protein
MFANGQALRFRVLLVTALLAIASFSCFSTAEAQTPGANQWTWMGGISSQPFPARGSPGVYGVLGTPAAANLPGSRMDASTWTDSKGRLWLFGGVGYDANGAVGDLNDLWVYDPSINQWAWMGGSSTLGPSATAQPGVYGTLGTPAPGNIPSGRLGAAAWVDSSGNLWLFGGQSTGVWLNDLWEFNPTTHEWAWMSGDSTVPSSGGNPGIYGTLGTPSAADLPGSRVSASAWTDSKGNFWLFGGLGYDANGLYNWLNDLWMFNPSTKEWTWMGGSSTVPCNTPDGCVLEGSYGTQGIPAVGNVPGGREGASVWTSGGRFWLFGGYGVDAVSNLGALNDLWEYDPATNEWTWISGSSMLLAGNVAPGVYGTLGTPAPGNVPPGRSQAASWTDISGNLWLFSGSSNGFLNDLWEFVPSTGEWTWMGGDPQSELNDVAEFGVYGTLGTPGATNLPGIRYGAASWTDNAGNFWLLGGDGDDLNDPLMYLLALNDLWKYQPSSSPSFQQTATPTFGVAPGTYTSTQSVALADATSGATIYYTTDGSTPTVSSTPYTAPIAVSLYSTAETLSAMAVAPNSFDSSVATATYVIDLPSSSATVTTLSSSLNPSGVGLPVTFTATVFAVSASATPAGTVQFAANGEPMGSPVALNASGVASYITSALTAGGGSITATYIPASGSPFATSTSAPLDQSVYGPCAGISSTTLTSSPNPSGAGQSVTFNIGVAMVAAPECVAGGGTTAPFSLAGTVQFSLNGAPLGSPVNVPSNGEASWTISSLPVGDDSIVATYTEDNGFMGSSVSAPLTQVVTATAPSPSFALAPASAAMAMQPGGSSAVNIAIDPLNGFSGSVTLSAAETVNGVTALFSPNPASSTSVLTLAADSTTVPGVYSVEVSGSSGSMTAQTSLQFAVDTAGSTPPTFGSSSSIVSAGATATYPVMLPSSLVGPSVTCLNLPAGTTCSFSGNTLSIATSATTPAGTYQIAVVFMNSTAIPASILLPLLLLPLLRLRKSLAAGGIVSAVCLALILAVGAAIASGCSGGSSTTTIGTQQQIVQSASVSLTVQ